MMLVDPDPPVKRLPFELEIRILSATVRTMTSTSKIEAYVDTYFDDVLHSTTFVSLKQGNITTTGGTIGSASGSSGSSSSTGGAATGSSAATTCTTTVIRPLHSLDPQMRISFVVHRNKLSSSALATAGRLDLLLGHLIEDKGKGLIEHEYALKNTNNRYLQLAIGLKEQKLFSVQKVNPKLLKAASGGEVVEVVLSPRLKDKIIILSLAIGSNCNGLLDEIVGFLTEAVDYITELDLFDIVDDINQMYKKSEFSKLITLLQDSDHPLKSVTPYPVYHSEWCVYTKLIPFPPPQSASASASASAASGRHSASSSAAATASAILNAPPTPSKRSSARDPHNTQQNSFQQRLDEVAQRTEEFHRFQPYLSRDHMPGFLKQSGEAPEVANITPGLRGYRLTICCTEGFYYELVTGNFYEYIQMQKTFSVLKYQPEEIESGHFDASWQVLYYPASDDNNNNGGAVESVKVTFELKSDNSCFRIVQGEDSEPVSIMFDEVSEKTISNNYYLR